MAEPTIGRHAVLRVAGCPGVWWLRGGNPPLFAELRRLAGLEALAIRRGEQLAALIGADLVPDPRLTRDERAAALRARRQAHRGAPIAEADARVLAACFGRLGDRDDLAGRLARTTAVVRTVEERRQAAMDAVAAEPARVARTAWEVARSSPTIAAVVGERPDLLAGFVARGDERPEAWGDKAVRHRAEAAWEVIDRAATRSTPRGWYAHAALLPIVPAATATAVALDGAVAAHWTENLHAGRDPGKRPALGADPATRVTVTPLHWRNDEHLACLAPAHDYRVGFTEVVVRRTPLLEAVMDAVEGGRASPSDIAAAVLEGDVAAERAALARFLDHLVELGVLQASDPPAERWTGWSALPAERPTGLAPTPDRAARQAAWFGTALGTSAPAGGADGGPHPGVGSPPSTGFVDVYRRGAGALADADVERLEQALGLAIRTLAAAAGAGPRGLPLAAGIDHRPRPLLDLVRERLDGENAPPLRHPERGWPAAGADRPYARLMARLDAGIVSTSGDLTIDADLLDAVGAPPAALGWPVDCLLRVPRPGAGYAAVLDQIAPAGTLDARFVDAFRRFHGAADEADAYRLFLARTERDGGAPFVEVLAPPLAEGAANAVRRPAYTRWWTGDPDAAAYLTEGPTPARYIPLRRITVRLGDAGIVVEADGQPIVPVYHATRIPLPPWNLVVDLLMASSPQVIPWAPLRLGRSLDAFPGRAEAPRIVVGDGLVVACAQWRIDPSDAWDPAATLFDKTRALARLRGRRGLPRAVVVYPADGGQATAADLDGIRAIRVLERAGLANGTPVLVAEMLPRPDDGLATDAAHAGAHVATELLLRLPVGSSPAALARRLAPAVRDRATGRRG